MAGINHQAFFLEFKHKEKDAYQMLREAMKKPEIYERDKVRFEMMKALGYFITESSHHLGEYIPYFRTSEERRRNTVSLDGFTIRFVRKHGSPTMSK